MKPVRPTVRLPRDLQPAAKRAMSTSKDPGGELMMSEKERTVLLEAAAGLKVDALDLNSALMAAMRSCATRHGQSMARRQHATEVWLMATFCQQALERAEPGPRLERRPMTPAEVEVFLSDSTDEPGRP